MLLKRIILEDFGLFRGRNELDLTPRVRSRQRRPVVLIGGKNGSGKTTVLDALRLCLYGPLALGIRVSAREYEAYLADRIHRAENTLFQRTAASVAIEFDYAQAGEVSTYFVERRWERHEKSLRTSLTVRRNGQALDELDREHADDFLRDLVPPGVSQLFFFDGEKIQQLADSEQDHVALADAVRGLIGLDHVERLRTDLRIYASKLQDDPGVGPLRERLEALSKEKEAFAAKQLDAVSDLDQSRSQRDRIHQDIAREEQKLALSGGAFASKRASLLAEKEQLGKSLGEVEGEVRVLCEGLLPFLLAPELCRDLKAQLMAEREVVRWRAHEIALRGRLDEIKTGIDETLFPPGEDNRIAASARVGIRQRVEQMLEGLVVPPPELPLVPVIHRLSDDDRDRLLSAVGRVENELPPQLGAFQQRLERSTRRLQEIEDGLGKIPDDDTLQPLLDRLQGLHKDLGSAQAAVDRSKAALQELDLRLGEVNRQLKKVEEKLDDAAKTGDRGVLVAKVQSALEDFARELTEAKVAELRDAVVRSFSLLWRKGDLVRRIEFDPSDLRVTLYDRHDRPLPKQRLSAGEKQIYAISLLWALAQVSGRPLPVIIDTPLGRLDNDHRGNLVTRYFPHASHQVVILSTDTEIDQNYFRELAPVASHAYHLRYDEAEARCVVEKGYFWAQGKEVAGAAE